MRAKPQSATISPPADVPHYARPIWYSCLHWAIGNEEILAAFKADTGLSYSAPRCALDAMIDDATGLGNSVVVAFVPWFNQNIWGAWQDPPAEESSPET
jgi:hypothetical protein